MLGARERRPAMALHRHRGAGLMLLGALVVALAGCGDGGDDARSTTTTGPTEATTTTAEPADDTTTTTEDAPDQSEVRAYFLRDEKVGPVAREATDEAVGAVAVQAVLDGPTPAEQDLGFSSAVPAGPTLLGIVIEGGIATVDLSEEFTSGGGSVSMMGRVAQVVFTLTQFPTVDAVSFSVGGTPLTALGGEGLMLEEPQTRADWESFAPAILVEAPLPFAEVSSPLRITGTANTFEAAFTVNVTDAEGLIVYGEPAMATSGSGTRGTFDVTATFEVPRPGLGAVIVFEESAEDGQPVNVVEIPVQMSS